MGSYKYAGLLHFDKKAPLPRGSGGRNCVQAELLRIGCYPTFVLRAGGISLMVFRPSAYAARHGASDHSAPEESNL